MSLVRRLVNANSGTFTRLAVVLLILIPLGSNAGAQKESVSEDQVPSWRYQTPSAMSSPDTRTPTEIYQEDKYFDSRIGASYPLDGPPPDPRMPIIMSDAHHASFNEDFPARFRDEVVIAHYSTWTTHLSSSHYSVYTIINLKVDRIVSDKSGRMVAGSTIPLAIPGGTVLSPTTQKTISYRIVPNDFTLEPNTEYLIFLDSQTSSTFYQYVKAWKVDKGILEPVTLLDSRRMSEGTSPHGGMPLESATRELGSH